MESFDTTLLVIQARMGSSRFPGKVLHAFCKKPLLLFMIDKIRKFDLGLSILVATSTNPLDDKIEQFCHQEHIPFFRGSEPHVFERFQEIAKIKQPQNIIRLTADNPLVQKEILQKCLEYHFKEKPDLTSTRKIDSHNQVIRYAPKGYSIDIIKTETLLTIPPHTLSAYEQEHVIPVFYKKFKVCLVKDFQHLKGDYSIDTPEDLIRLEGGACSL